jgi:protein SCO1
MERKLLIVVLAGFLIGAFAGASVLVLNTGAKGTAPVAISGKALIGGPFALIDQTGKTVTERDFRGRFMLVYFGFTHCPDICPAELQVMAQALDRLGDKAEQVVPVFITVDPERDTPEVVADYVKNFGARFVGLTGSSEAVAAAAKAYRVPYSKVEDKTSANDYSVDHSALVYFMDPKGEYLAHFPYGTSAETMAETMRRNL